MLVSRSSEPRRKRSPRSVSTCGSWPLAVQRARTIAIWRVPEYRPIRTRSRRKHLARLLAHHDKDEQCAALTELVANYIAVHHPRHSGRGDRNLRQRHAPTHSSCGSRTISRRLPQRLGNAMKEARKHDQEGRRRTPLSYARCSVLYSTEPGKCSNTLTTTITDLERCQ